MGVLVGFIEVLKKFSRKILIDVGFCRTLDRQGTARSWLLDAFLKRKIPSIFTSKKGKKEKTQVLAIYRTGLKKTSQSMKLTYLTNKPTYLTNICHPKIHQSLSTLNSLRRSELFSGLGELAKNAARGEPSGVDVFWWKKQSWSKVKANPQQ